MNFGWATRGDQRWPSYDSVPLLEELVSEEEYLLLVKDLNTIIGHKGTSTALSTVIFVWMPMTWMGLVLIMLFACLSMMPRGPTWNVILTMSTVGLLWMAPNIILYLTQQIRTR